MALDIIYTLTKEKFPSDYLFYFPYRNTFHYTALTDNIPYMDRLGNIFRYMTTDRHLQEVSELERRQRRLVSLAHGRYHSKKYAQDIGFRIRNKWQARVVYYMKNRLRVDKFTRLGCTQWEFREHIESQMSGDMWWDNYGTLWEVDHVVPVCKFDLPKEIFQCFHYTNLRPRLVALNSLEGMKLRRKYWHPLRNS